jgi:serine/threonine protein kinase
MKQEIFVNPAFKHIERIIDKIPENFSSQGIVIHSGRNVVKSFNEGEITFTAKYFKKITLVNRLIFATVRKSKARRSYEHSELLLKKGINTPEPVAYINCYRYGLLFKSFYVSTYCNFNPLSKLIAMQISESEEGLRAFARFTYKLHSSGILHNDYTIKNILYSEYKGEYTFSLIDNNRMRFRKYSYSRRIKDLERLKIPVDKLGIIAAEYAKQANTSDIRTLNTMLFFRIRYLFKGRLKGWAKSILSF